MNLILKMFDLVALSEKACLHLHWLLNSPTVANALVAYVIAMIYFAGNPLFEVNQAISAWSV